MPLLRTRVLKREWVAESNGKLRHLSILSKTVAWVPEFAVEDLPLGRTTALVPVCSEGPALGQNTLIMMMIDTYLLCVYLYLLPIIYVGQATQEARRLAMGWTARVRFRVSKRWRFFFTPSCPYWS